jgi:hypothetical protein
MWVVEFAKGFVRAPLSHWPFVPISRTVFGNTAGFRQNFYGAFSGGYHRLLGNSSSKFGRDPEVRSIVEALKRDGLAAVQGWIDPQYLTELREKILRLIETEGIKEEYISRLDARTVEQNIPEVFDILSDKVTTVIEEYYGSSFLVETTSFRLTQHVPEQVLTQGEVYSNHWHCDTCPATQVAVFIILNDVSEKDGPTAALTIAGTREAIRQGYTSRKRDDAVFERMENLPSKVEFVGPAGTMLFANVAKCLHRAGIPEPGRHREWLQFRIFPSREATDTRRLKVPRIKNIYARA